MTDIKERANRLVVGYRTGGRPHKDTVTLPDWVPVVTGLLDRIEELEAERDKITDLYKRYVKATGADEIAAAAAERERINVAVTRAMCGYGPDDPIWHTIDHVARVMEAAKEKTDD